MLARFRFFSFVGVLSCVVLAGCGSEPVVIPTSYTLYNAKDGTFECDAPDGWETKGGGKNASGPVWAKFISGPATIHFKASPTSLLANAALSGRGAEANAVPNIAPVHLIHVATMDVAKEDYDDYTEIAGSPVVMNCVLGPARLSEFTYKTSFGTQMHGYRVSIIGHKKGITSFCTCPESDWKSLNPVFDKVLASLERGTAE